MKKRNHKKLRYTPIPFYRKTVSLPVIISTMIFSLIISFLIVRIVAFPPHTIVSQSVEGSIPTITPTPTTDPQYSKYDTTENTDPNQRIYTSNELGIRFKFIQQQGDTTIYIKRIAQRVYIYPGISQPEAGESVEVLLKEPSHTIQEAIKRRFLADFSDKDCTIIMRNTAPPGFIKAEIHATNVTDNLPLQSTGKCPLQYTTTDGVRYFLMDTKHPNVFMFFNIGHYPIQGTNDKLWEDTIEVLR